MENVKVLLGFLIRRDIVSLYKLLLNVIEDLKQDHLVMLKKLESKLPKEYHYILKDADYFDVGKYTYIRKKILDIGNESLRNTEEQLSKFEINLGNKEK